MKLHSITYTEYEDKEFAWKIDAIDFININLIVGKNSTGKSRVLRVIDGLARLLEGVRQPNGTITGDYVAVFKDKSSELVYSFQISDMKVIKESLAIDGEIKLNRGRGGKTSIWFEQEGFSIDVQIPEIHLAASARRDAEQHPFFEPLHLWAKTVKYFESSKLETHALTAFEGKLAKDAVEAGPLNLHLIIKSAKDRWGRNFVRPVINDMVRIGYKITDFGLAPQQGVNLPLAMTNAPQAVYLLEEGVPKKLMQNEISTGMLRALATLIFMHYIRLLKKGGIFLIDDIGEGLDFDRATKLLKILIEEAEQGFIQLVMTTNDRFVMNEVPLGYWSVIQRTAGMVKVFNQRNHPKEFAEFEEYGFNNFDFFAKEFYVKGMKIDK